MKKLITENQALGYYGTIADNIEKYKSRPNVQTTSADLPLFVDQIGRLREVFQKVLSAIEDSEISSDGKLGTKLNAIITTYPPSNKNVTDYIFSAWTKVNNAKHYWEQEAKGVTLNYELKHYKNTLKNLCEFISEYSGALIPEKIIKFCVESHSANRVINKPVQQNAPVITPKTPKIQTQHIPLTPRQKELTAQCRVKHNYIWSRGKSPFGIFKY